jgi:prephenate dehydrogenase
MAPTVSVLLLGTGLVGRSIGLALRRAGEGFERVGFDPDVMTARQAREADAIDRATSDVAGAAAKADLVVINLPIRQALDVSEVLAEGIRPDTAVLVTYHLQTSLLEGLRQRLPGANPILGAVPFLGPQRALGPVAALEPSADLFDGGSLGIILPSGTPEAAAQICLDLAAILGAGPFFLDAAEADSVAATSDELPAVVAVAVLASLTRNPGWRDQQRLVGSAFAALTAAAGGMDPDELAQEILTNRPNLAARLQALVEEASDLQALLESGSEAEVTDRLSSARDLFDLWIKTRREAKPDLGFEVPGVPRISMFDRLFGRRRSASGSRR